MRINQFYVKVSIVVKVLLLTIIINSFSQGEVRRITLQQAIEIAKQQSPDALLAKHRFRASYWQYRSYRASYMPSLLLTGSIPNFNRSINTINTVEGDVFSAQTINRLYAGLSLNQKVGFSGGTLSLNSDLMRLDNYLDSTTITQYNATAINISYRQPIFKYNDYKWERKMEPMKYEESKKKYLEDMEQVSVMTTNHFFNLLLAQIAEKIAILNEANYDTLYKIAQGRYNLGKIAENDLLQLELQYLRASSSVQDAQLEVENQLFKFKSYLRIKDDLPVQLVEPVGITPIVVDAGKAVQEARVNSSDALAFNRRLLEAESEVARAKLDGRFDADIFAVYGLTQSSIHLDEVYKSPLDQQQLQIGISLPILDWGVARGRIKMAQSNQEIVRTSIEQEQLDFDQGILLRVAQFNMQYNQVMISAKADTVAKKGYEITKARYLIGKISITDLNIAQTEADNSKRSFFNTLRTYWRNYYDLRKLTLFDFERNIPIMVNYQDLL